MNSSHPKTYLPLPNPEANFAEVYGKRLLYPFTCPNDGQRDEECQCTDKGNPKAGKTVFHKVRVDLHNMKIIGETDEDVLTDWVLKWCLLFAVDDYTFSSQEYGTSVRFGSGGDCYSAVDCPQGRFQVESCSPSFQ